MRRRLAALTGKSRREAEMDAEMRMHLELRVEKNIAAGMSVPEARFAAWRTFGGVEQIKERARDQWGGVWLSHLAQDLRYGVRMLQKWPVFSRDSPQNQLNTGSASFCCFCFSFSI